MGTFNPSYFIVLLVPLGLLFYWIRFAINKIRDLRVWFGEVAWLDKNFSQAEMLAGIRPNDSAHAYFYPKRNFYKLLSQSRGIDKCIKSICNYIGYSGPTILASFHETTDGPPAQIRGSHITIQQRYRTSPYSLAALLAHEITHAYLAYNCKQTIRSEDSELLTDYVAICLGLGKLILNGRKKTISSSWSGAIHTVTTQTTHFGYLSFASFLYAYEKDRKLKNIPKSAAYKLLRIPVIASLLLQNIFVNFRTKRIKKTEEAPETKIKLQQAIPRQEVSIFNCSNCGKVEHIFLSNNMGLEKWKCSKCGKILNIERF